MSLLAASRIKMMKYYLKSRSLCLLLILSLSMWGYYILLGNLGDPRVADSSLDSEEMYVWEVLLLALSLLSLFYLWACSLVHCFKNKRIFVAILIMLIWPLTYIYSLYILSSHVARNKAR